MNTRFKRNDVQDFIESELNCKELSKWKSYSSQLDKWEINNSNIAELRLCIKSDSVSYYMKALQSFTQSLFGLHHNFYTWSIIKLYYAVFYLLRCQLLASGFFFGKEYFSVLC
jgi:hypothetical protein